MIVLVRIGSQLPISLVNASALAQSFSAQMEQALSFFDAITGGSFQKVSIFALSITPYITSSIIMQLLTIAFTQLEEMQKEGEEGRKKIQQITRVLTVGLSLLEGVAISIGFGRSGYIYGWTAETGFGKKLVMVVLISLILTAGSALLMWMGERITQNGIGNGISIILLVNIISRLPHDFAHLYDKFIVGKDAPVAILSGVIVLAVVIGTIVFVIFLQDGVRKIPVQYSKKIVGRKTVGGASSHIPLKVNTAGVIPIIFAQSILQTPVVIASLMHPNQEGWGGKIIAALSQQNWANPQRPWMSIGLLVYILLIVFFAYFYTSITFNPLEIADNMKKQGGFIPGIRPGKPTVEYLNGMLGKIIFVGAIGLIVVSVIPIVASGVFQAQVSFGGTSLIIIVGVVIETLKQIESQVVVRSYKGFLTD